MRNAVEQRVAWDDLPGPLRQAIEARTGRITGVRMATAGQNSPLAAIVDARDGKAFVKGMPSAHRRVVTQAREAAVASFVSEISPALLWHFDEAGWNVLGYEYVDGRHADYAPGSPDLDRLVHLMDALSAIKVPHADGPFKRGEDRWKPYVDDPESAWAFAGSVLTHSDWTPDNELVSPDRAWLIDWAWPTLGAAWTDPGLLDTPAHGLRRPHRTRGRTASLPPPGLPGRRPSAHRPVRRSQRPAVGRDRPTQHDHLDESHGTSRARVVRLSPSPPRPSFWPGTSRPHRRRTRYVSLVVRRPLFVSAG
jgi:hypothetical protein